jgi:hypothetical protein
LKTGRGRKKVRRTAKPVFRKSSKAPARKRRAARKKEVSRGKSPVSRARATKPARHTTGRAASHGLISLVHRKRKAPLPSPLPTKHVAPPRPVLVVPARSMPPARDPRKQAPLPQSRGVLAPPDFGEAGVLLAITYSIREGRRGEFFDLMRELKPMLAGIGGTDCTVYEDRSRPNYLMEVFRFKDEAEFTAFDDKFHKDRKIAAIYALLDDIVEAEKSDFKIFERRL